MREEGYYWVKDDSKWEVAEWKTDWVDIGWYLTTLIDCFVDEDFEEIDERRIERHTKE